MKRFDLRTAGSLAVLLCAAISCSQDPIVVPGRTLDRPTDLAFLCLARVSGSANVTALPASACTNPTTTDDTRDTARLGLVANSARGELGAVDFDRNRMIDLDKSSAGFNMLPVGQLPESVAVSSDGCRALTANRGSCDVSVVDTTRLLAGVFPDSQPSTGPGAVTNRLTVFTASGPLRARPSEVAFVPGPSPTRADEVPFQCRANAAFGSSPWRAVVTYPVCGLVALIDVTSGQLLDSVYVGLDGKVTAAGRNPQCPVECGVPGQDAGVGPSIPLPSDQNRDASVTPESSEDASIDKDTGLPSDANADAAVVAPEPLENVVTGRLAVGATAFLPFAAGTLDTSAPQQLYVGGRNAHFVVPLVVNGQSLSSARSALALAENARGVLRIRPSVDPFQGAGSFLGTLGRFLYVIAADGTARVVYLGPDGTPPMEEECDANIDSAALAARSLGVPEACVPVNSGLPRRLGARGPGIQPPPEGGRGSAPPAAVDVAFFQATPAIIPDQNLAAQRFYAGSFAYLLLTNGDILVVNLDPTPRRENEVQLAPGPQLVPPPAHSLRNARRFQDPGRTGGPPRVVGVPTSTLTTNDLPFALRSGLPRPLFPRIEEFPKVTDPYCSPLAGATLPQSIFACFPRPNEAVDQRWQLNWEGTLEGTERVTGQLIAGPPGSVGSWSDAGAQFCGAGVQPKDRLRIFGCVTDENCGDPKIFRCVASASGGAGLCVRTQRAAAVAAAPECQRFLASRRRYEVLQAGSTQLALGLALDEQPRPTTLGPCMTPEDCRPAGVASPESLTCTEVVPGEANRCVRPCEIEKQDKDCRPGFVCEQIGTKAFCVEAPPPSAFCLEDNGFYGVQAGQAFVVTGSRTAPIATAVEEAGICKPLVSLNPRHSNRLPLSAPICTNQECGSPEAPPSWEVLKNPMTAVNPGPRPCLCQGRNANGLPDDRPHTKAFFEASDVRFMVTNLEQPFGDGASISFQTTGGFWPDWILVPQSGLPSIAVPTRLMVGPTKVPRDDDDKGAISEPSFPYIYMVDSGRLGAQQRGQILRLDTRRAVYDTGRSTRPFEVQ